MSASTGDWWRKAVRVGSVYADSPETVADVLRAALPLFVAEATRRIEAEKRRFPGSYSEGVNDGLNQAAAVLAGLAGEVGQHD